jgi:hypothetical protein
MNNQLEIVWKKYPQLLIGFEFKIDLKSGTIIKKLTGIPYKGALSFDLISGAVNAEQCTLLTRSIDSLTDEELLEAESTFNIPSYKSVTKWLMDNKERLDVFIWLLSKGIWTGSKEGVEVVE